MSLRAVSVQLHAINARIDGLQSRMDRQDARLDKIDARFDLVESRAAARPEQLLSALRRDERITRLEQKEDRAS